MVTALRNGWIVGLALALSGAGGCGDDDAPGGSGRVELGTGGLGTFDAVEEGETLLLARGCQGSQHVWGALRIYDLDPTRVIVRLELTRARDGERVSVPLEVSLTFMPEDGYAEISGITLQVPVPEDALGEDLIYSAHVTDRNGATAEASMMARVDWGEERCGASDDGGSPDGGPADAAQDAPQDAEATADAAADGA